MTKSLINSGEVEIISFMKLIDERALLIQHKDYVANFVNSSVIMRTKIFRTDEFMI
jgi:hypothetical protein